MQFMRRGRNREESDGGIGMGRKYTSIHVFTQEVDRVSTKLMKEYTTELPAIFKTSKRSNIIEDDSYQYILDKLKTIMKTEVLVIQGKSLVSIYDSNNTFENISDKAQKVSKISSSVAVYTANFDDDIFLIGIYNNGVLTTSGNYGEMLPDYELEFEKIDQNQLVALSVDKTIGIINHLAGNSDIEEIEECIEHMLNVPLSLTLEDIEENQEVFSFVFSNEEKSLYNWKRD